MNTNMTDQEFEIMVNKVINAAPDWLKKDIEYIINKEGIDIRISTVISKLNSQYSFNMTHIFTSMNRDVEWAVISRQRLTFIDNNLDLIDYLVKDMKKNANK
jgi:hypothetical protein